MSSELKQLVEAGVHFGHRTSRWHPKMRSYIWGSRNQIHLINVAKTLFLLKRAQAFLQEVSASGKPVLLIGTKKAAAKAVRSFSTKLGMPFVAHRWIGGTLSNFEQVRKAVTRLLHLRDAVAKTDVRRSKKEMSMMTKELERLERSFAGIIDLKSLPAAVVVVDAKRERSAVKEALGMNIPVVSLVDTNTDPTGISYIIPANDDSPRSIEHVLGRLAESIAAGKKVHDEAKAAERAKAEAARKAAREARAAKEAKANKPKSKEEKSAAAKAKKETAAPVKKEAAKAPAKKAAPKKAPAKKADTAKAKPAVKKAPAAKKEAAPKAPAKKKAAPKKAAAKPAAKKTTKKKEDATEK